ncbi:M15 family peptidase [Mesobacillus subterraneus]|uniref:M15 family peptidase n=2 Tax=Mesobacillus subterraneus TaxID=285983 RepID=A0A3R9F2A0_9BACI|nr:M15 family metallopeptidase [Mesobacillus subterraneus]RSD28311.1 M15 family peptidase [Mesobacillus subterraneus]
MIALLLYFQFLTRPEINENVPLPQDLHPVVQEKRDLLIEQAAGKGIKIIITDGFRGFEEQDRLYEKGRSTEGQIVTHARGGESYHNFGLAIDFALLDRQGKALWDMSYDGNGNAKSDWIEVVAIAKDLGFEWGGDWSHFKDYPHLEMRFGLTINDLKRGKRPPGDSLTASQK